MPLRKTVFWLHLASGCIVAAIVLVMSVTGVILTYELQITQWANDHDAPPADSGDRPIPIAALVASASAAAEGAEPSGITIRNDADAPAVVGFGRQKSLYVNRYTGQVLGEGSQKVRDFFRWVVGWHRWLGREGDSRTIARHVTGASNLAFLFLVISGLYLWFPRHWRWSAFRQVLWFRRGLSSKARDWNWHHVIGFWCWLPLFIVVLSGVVISYGWAGRLLTRVTGGEVAADAVRPAPSPPQTTAGSAANPGDPQLAVYEPPLDPFVGIDEAFRRAEGYSEGWRTISFQVPESAGAPVVFTIDHGTGRQPQKKARLTLSPATGEVLAWEPHSALPLHQRARSFMRFGHTGEYFGVIGQTIAGVASAGAVVLVYTGLALSFRRLVLSPIRARRQRLRTQTAPDAGPLVGGLPAPALHSTSTGGGAVAQLGEH